MQSSCTEILDQFNGNVSWLEHVLAIVTDHDKILNSFLLLRRRNLKAGGVSL